MAEDRTQFLNDFSERWLQAWNSHDTEQVLAVTHPDISWDDRTFWPSVVHGHAELREYTEAIWKAMPDVEFGEIGRFFDPDGERAIVMFRQTGSAPDKLGVDGRFDSYGCDIFLRFEDGLLAEYRAAYDIVQMMEQMGAIPPRGSKLGGAYLLSLMKEPATSTR